MAVHSITDNIYPYSLSSSFIDVNDVLIIVNDRK